jgi:ATP-dependent Clp protease ATP-binding subunit ClpC
MFDRFTDDAKSSMNVARKVAQRFRHDFIGPEHMLLGLLSVDGCAARLILQKLGVDLSKFSSEFEQSLVIGPQVPVVGQFYFTPGAKKALELSMDEAARLGDTQLDTDHFLLGLIGCEDSRAAPALLKIGVTLDAARALAIERRG